MTNFHENKLWQDSYVALMDIHDVVDEINDEKHEEIIEALLEAAQDVASKIADGLTRTDRRFARELIFDAVGLVAVTRTQLAVAWGRGLVDDETFRGLDNKYASLTQALQQFK